MKILPNSFEVIYERRPTYVYRACFDLWQPAHDKPNTAKMDLATGAGALKLLPLTEFGERSDLDLFPMSKAYSWLNRR